MHFFESGSKWNEIQPECLITVLIASNNNRPFIVYTRPIGGASELGGDGQNGEGESEVFFTPTRLNLFLAF